MRSLVAGLLIASGIALLAVAIYPWMGLRMGRPRRYHYYYLSPEALRVWVAEGAAGLALIGTGGCLIALGRAKRR
jgi:hypothetical protein